MHIAVIIARGGSIRVPRKNVKPFCGKPLVAWTLIQSKCSHLIDDVYLSTDDDEIEAIGHEYGVKVIRRPDWPDADQVAANRPLLHAVEHISDKLGHDDWDMVTMFPTSPIRFPYDMDNAIAHHRRTRGNLAGMVRNRETFIYRDIMGLECRAVITDKFKRYFTLASGVISIQPASWYKWFAPRLGTDLDDVLNEQSRNPDECFNQTVYYWEFKPYQAWETDVIDEFRMCELAFEYFVLKGRGAEIYQNYYKEGL